MIYLDNAATTFPKPEAVYDAMMDCMKNYCANPGRAGHKLAMKAAREIYDTRENIAKLFNIDNPMNIVFTNNATESLNLAIKGVVLISLCFQTRLVDIVSRSSPLIYT